MDSKSNINSKIEIPDTTFLKSTVEPPIKDEPNSPAGVSMPPSPPNTSPTNTSSRSSFSSESQSGHSTNLLQNNNTSSPSQERRTTFERKSIKSLKDITTSDQVVNSFIKRAKRFDQNHSSSLPHLDNGVDKTVLNSYQSELLPLINTDSDTDSVSSVSSKSKSFYFTILSL